MTVREMMPLGHWSVDEFGALWLQAGNGYYLFEGFLSSLNEPIIDWRRPEGAIPPLWEIDTGRAEAAIQMFLDEYTKEKAG